MATYNSFKKSSKGGALIAALLLVVITLLLTTGYVDTLTNENKTAKDNENSQLALYAADAGIQYALEAVRSSTTSYTYSTNNVGGTFLTTPSGNNVQFVLQQSGTSCPIGFVPPSGCTGGCINGRGGNRTHNVHGARSGACIARIVGGAVFNRVITGN